MIVAPKIRGFICTTAHPDGCAAHVAEQIAVVKNRGPIEGGPKKVVKDMVRERNRKAEKDAARALNREQIPSEAIPEDEEDEQ